MDGVHDVGGEAGAVLGGAAVLVRALVPDRGEELVHEVADVGVDLDGVEARVAHKPGAVLPELHHFGYLLDGEGVALDLGSQTQVFSEAEMGSLPWISLALRPVPQESCMTALQP